MKKTNTKLKDAEILQLVAEKVLVPVDVTGYTVEELLDLLASAEAAKQGLYDILYFQVVETNRHVIYVDAFKMGNDTLDTASKVGAFIFEDQLHDFIQQSVESQDDLSKLVLVNRKYPL